MSAFWDGFEKQGSMKKEAIFGAIAAHLGQNVLMKKLLRSKRFAKGLAQDFQHGLKGQSPSHATQFVRGLAYGATVPEAKMLRDHARELGGHISKSLREQGITHLSPKDISLARSLSQGRFSRLLDSKHFQAENPTHQALLSVANQHLGTGITADMLKGSSPEALKGHLEKLEQTWRSKQSPITSNLFHHLTKNPGKPGFVPRQEMDKTRQMLGQQPIDLRPKSSLAGGLLGSAATGAIDPATGVLNAGKVTISNPASRGLISQHPLGQKALAASDNKLFTQPIQAAGQAGLEGKRTSPLLQHARSLGLNAVTAEAENTANRLGVAANPLLRRRA